MSIDKATTAPKRMTEQPVETIESLKAQLAEVKAKAATDAIAAEERRVADLADSERDK